MVACSRAISAAVLADAPPAPISAQQVERGAGILRTELAARRLLGERAGTAPGAAAEHQRFGQRVAGQPVGAVGAADHLAGDKQAGHAGVAMSASAWTPPM